MHTNDRLDAWARPAIAEPGYMQWQGAYTAKSLQAAATHRHTASRPDASRGRRTTSNRKSIGNALPMLRLWQLGQRISALRCCTILSGLS